MLQLSDKWAAALLGERETGMGYQVVTIQLKDGRRFAGVTVTGGTIASIDGYDDIPFSEGDIAAIAVTHDRGRHGGTQEPAPRASLDEANSMTTSQSAGRPEFFVCHDYGQGGLWAIVRADSAEQVRQRFPGLPVFESPPPGLDAGAIEVIRRNGVMAVEDPPVGWLADYARNIG